MIKVEITDGNTTFLLSPHSIEIPDVRNMNESLQHEEQTCKMTAVFDVDLLSLLMNHADLQACVSDGETSLFTGFVDNNTDFTDNGEPEPADIINITIRDRTRLFDITTESEVAQIGKTLSQIVSVICQNCNVTNAAVFSDNPQVAAFVLDKDKKYLDALNTLLFQYGYTWFFNEDGEFEVLKINLQNVTESITDSDLFTGLNISKTRKNYNAIKVIYGTLTKKGNEQVFFTGNGLGGDNKVVPFTIRPGQYYPYESDPAQEQREGKVFQNFESGYAEEYTTYSGEKKFRRATNQPLIYTENHKVVEDWDGSIVINRTEYGARSAAVRLLNTGTEDAELKQFAIRADAYYRSSNNSVTVGSGKKEYSYEAEHIYDDTAASNLATLLSKLYTDTCIKFSGKIRRNIKPGTICSIDTGLSGITCNALVINSQYDPENDLHTITLNSISEVQMNSSRYKERKSENSLTENLALLDEAISDLKDGTADVGNPDSVEGLTAVAKRDSISISWSSARDNGLSNSIKYYILKISKDNGVSWSTPIYLTDCSYEYVFTRSGQGSDGYPEASAFDNWKVEVVAENIYGKKSAVEQEYVDADNYGTWIPTVPSDVKAVANKDYILLSWSCNLRGVYGTNLYRIKKNGTTIAEGIIENSFVYYFDRSSNEYPEKSDFDTNTWKFTVEVYNESPTTRYADAVYDKSNYKSWLPAIPRMGVTSSGRTISVDIRTDDSYWGWDRFELQLSNDNQNWFAANTSESYDAYANEDGWKGGAADTDTDILSTQFYMELPLSGQAADNPENTSYYVRVRAVTHTNTDNNSAFCESIMVVAKASGVKDIVNSAVTTAKLANEAVTGDKISADTITARKLNVVATNLVNPIINDTPSDSSVTRAVSRWSGLKAISDPATGFVIGERTGNISSDAFTILPDAVYEFKFGIECSNYASGSGLYIGLDASQSLKAYKWNATKKQWFYVSTETNQYFLKDYKNNSRKYFTTYILGSNVQTGTGTSTTVPAQNIPAPVMTDNTYEIQALQLTGTLRETFIRSGNNTISGSPVWKIITPQIYERNSSAVTAEDIKTQNLSAINANLGDVATGSLSSATNSDGKPDPANSLVHINGTAGSEEFFIGNIKKSSASETNTNHEFMWLHKVNGVFTFILKITNFIVTSTQSIIKGILRIKNSLSDTDANAFLTVNPTSSTNNSTPANTMRLLGTMQTKGIKKEWTRLDLSSLDASKWFPVTISLSTDDWTEIDCYVSLDSGTKPSWSSHASGFTCHLHLLAMGSGWGSTSAQTLVLDRQYGFTTVNNVTVIPAGWTQMTNSSTGVLWLRGGGKYRVWNNKGIAFTIRTSTYTVSDQSVTPTTSYQWSFTRAQMWGNIDGNAATSTQADFSRQGAYCTTAAATQAKTASMRGFTYASGTTFLITFANANSYNGLITLNINGTGAKNIWINGGVSSSSNKTLPAGTYLCFCENSVYKIDTTWCVPFARVSSSCSGNAASASSCSGNSATATATPCCGYCNTASNISSKVVSMPNWDGEYSEGIFLIKFQYENIARSAITLNINNTGAKAVDLNSSASSATNYYFTPGIYPCRYDGNSNKYYLYTLNQVPAATHLARTENGDVTLQAVLCTEHITTAADWSNSHKRIPAIKAQYANTTSGYIVFTNGLKIQWGRSTSQGARDKTLSFTFPVAFSAIPLCVSSGQAIDSTMLVTHCLTALSTTGCSVHSYGSGSSTSAGYLGYIAIGY